LSLLDEGDSGCRTTFKTQPIFFFFEFLEEKTFLQANAKKPGSFFIASCHPGI
jgi:hypothetical protein